MLEAHISIINTRGEKDYICVCIYLCIIQEENGSVFKTPLSCKEICGINADNLHEWR